LFAVDRIRLGARLQAPIDEPRDDFGSDGRVLSNDGSFQPIDSEAPVVVYGGSVGVALIDLPGFVMSPGIYVLRSDVADYGTMLGFALPFEWVTRRGMRVGFDFGIVRSFGGEVQQQCTSFSPTGAPATCDPGEVRAFDREGGNGFFANFLIGWAFSQPNR
jgi:hypothetical protein